jgi:hypothetical protein
MKLLIKKLIPAFGRYYYQQGKQIICKIKGVKRKKRVVEYLQQKHNPSAEENEVLQYLLKTNRMTVFPYNYINNYKWQDIDIAYDKDLKMHFTVLFGNKRMYFKKKMIKRSCAQYINSIICEQDKQSPHCYLSDNFTVQDGAIVVDAGAAEGYFALSVIDRAKKIYLFEPDAEWREALKATFSPWSEKIEIVPRFVDEKSSQTTVSLDDFFTGKELPTFIKADIEGCEKQLLFGAQAITGTKHPLSIAICSYHKPNDFDDLSAILHGWRFSLTTSRGYMFLYTDDDAPYLRRGVIRALQTLD